MSKILRLTVNNILRIRTAEVNPDGSLVIVAGNNQQGKSSLLNCIGIALSGKDWPTEPIHKGANKGSIVLQTEDLTITRTFSTSGRGGLEVRDAEGKPVTAPQTKLDALVSRVSFDPLAFTKFDDKKQLETLRQILGLDFSALDTEYKDKFAQRTDVNRNAGVQNGKLQGIQRHGDAPAEPVSVQELTGKLTKAQQVNKANAARRESLSDCNDSVDGYTKDFADAERHVLELEGAVARAKQDAAEIADNLRAAIENRDKEKAEVAKLEDVPEAPIIQSISLADGQNAKLRDNARWNEEHKELMRLQQQSEGLTTRLEAIAAEKAKKIADAKFPIEGLGFTDEGVTLNGNPWKQAGSAEQIRASLAIARSLNPALPVMLIRDGSLLDEESLALVAAEADKYGLQVWLECVGNREDATVIIEDGEVAERPTKKGK